MASRISMPRPPRISQSVFRPGGCTPKRALFAHARLRQSKPRRRTVNMTCENDSKRKGDGGEDGQPPKRTKMLTQIDQEFKVLKSLVPGIADKSEITKVRYGKLFHHDL